MLDKRKILELHPVLNAQNNLLLKIKREIDNISTTFESNSNVKAKIIDAENILAEIEENKELLQNQNQEYFDTEDILKIYSQSSSEVGKYLKKIDFKDWNSFVSECQAYCAAEGLDPLQPYEALLTKSDLELIKTESFETQYTWDKLDYIFVGTSGILAAITDFLLVKIPKPMGNSNIYSGQKGSPLTAWLKDYTEDEDGWFSKWAKTLESRCKVPYDRNSYADEDTITSIGGMGPTTHRLQTLGHDPLLGFVFGVLDIMRGTISGFSYNKLKGHHNIFSGRQVWSNIEPVGLIKAILIHIGHLISDVGTPMGLPPPMFTLFQGINLSVPTSHKERTVGQIARWMYLNGYDFRHFLVSGITPAVIEMVLRCYLMLRHYSEHGETKFSLSGNPKYRSMLFAAHSIAVCANSGKVVLNQGNPLAINYAEWVAFLRYLTPQMKYWLFDKNRLKMAHLEQINDKGWNDLLLANDNILSQISVMEFQSIELGKSRTQFPIS